MDNTLCNAPTVQAGTDGFCSRPIGHSGPCADTRQANALSTMQEHELVLDRAARIFGNHTAEHGELWREADATELGAMVRHKGNRVNYASRRFQDGENREQERKRIVDSALDCINYCAFIIRLVEADADKN